MNFTIDEMKEIDWNQVSVIYMEGIETKLATFQSEAPSWKEWDKSHIEACRLVARSGNEILGWAALSPTSSRCVYKGVSEVSVYIGKSFRGMGIGSSLLKELVHLSEEAGFWSLQSGIIRENISSIHLHEKCGFRVIGIKEKPAKMESGEWHDVVLMERRSKLIG